MNVPLRHRIEYALFRSFAWFIQAMPLGAAQAFGRFLGRIACSVLAGRRRIAFDNLRHAFPEIPEREREEIARRAFENYGVAITELLWSPRLDDVTIRRLVRVRNLDLMMAGYREGKGMVMLAGHFGNWELIALAFGYLSGIPIHMIVQTQTNRLVDGYINKLRCRFGNVAVPMGMSVREVIRTLHDGGIVAIAPDQSGPMEGVFVDFFGRSVATHQGPAVFALRTGAPVQMGFMVRQPDNSYEVELVEVPAGDLHGTAEENVLELTRRHTKLLEQQIRQHPDHWLWMHRRWKHTEESVREARMTVHNGPA